MTTRTVAHELEKRKLEEELSASREAEQRSVGGNNGEIRESRGGRVALRLGGAPGARWGPMRSRRARRRCRSRSRSLPEASGNCAPARGARHGPGGDPAKAWAGKLCGMLKPGRIDDVLVELRRHGGGSAKCARAADYIDERRGRMRYDEYFARGLPIGSGRAEAACKAVAGRRSKHSMRS